jgi:hypothetical protein
MANTENIEAKLCAYVDGELDSDGRAEIERHLVANPSHRRLLEELVRGRALLRALPREDAPEDLIDDIQSQLERSVLISQPVDDEAAAVAGRINRWPHRLAAAAILLLAVGLAAVIVYVLPRTRDAEFAVTMTGEGGKAAAPGRGDVRLERAGDDATDLAERDVVAADRERDREVRVAEAPRGGGIGGGASPDLGDAGALAMKDAGGPGTPPAASVSPDATNVARAGAGAGAGGPLVVPAPSPTGTVIFSETFAKAPGGAAAGGDVRAAQDKLFNDDLARQLKQSPGGLKDNAMFVVVSTNDAAATKDQVASYLIERNILAAPSITWQPVSEPMPGPLDITASQEALMSRQNRTQVQMKGAPGAGAVEQPDQQLGQQQQQVNAAEAVESQPSDETAKTKLAAKAQPDPAAAAGGTRGAAAATTLPAEPARAEAKALAGQQIAPPAPTAPASEYGGMAPPQQQAQQAFPGEAQQETPSQVLYARGYADGKELIVARGMTRQQAVELQSTLTKQRNVQRAAVYGQTPGVAEPYAAPGGVFNTESEERMKREVSGGEAPSTSLPVAPADEPFPFGPTTSSTTRPSPETKIVVDGGATQPAERQLADAMAATKPAAAPGGGPFTLARAGDEDDDDERVDVVIVVHDEAATGVADEVVPGAPPAAPLANEEAQMTTVPGGEVHHDRTLPDPDPDAAAAAAAPPPAATQPAGVNAKPAERP